MYLYACLFVLALVSWPISGSNTGDLTYCSSQNTGTFLANTSIYQSNGNCEQYCSDDYAFGILQGHNCWCSNLAPASGANSDNSDCNDGCPGFPADPCGSTAKDLYGYLQMPNKMPTGTASLSSSAVSSTSASTESVMSATETVTVTASDSSISTIVTESTPSPTTDSTSSTSTTETTSTPATTTGSTGTTGTSGTSGDAMTTPSQTVSVHTLGGGEVKTVTVAMPSSTAAPDASVSKTSSGSGMKGGTIAGIVVGTVGGCAALLALIFVFFVMKRRKRASSPDPSVQNGLIDGGRSPQMGFFSDNHSHTLSAGSSTANRVNTFTDDRMKPNPLYPNGDRGSSVSLQDNEDYSRPVLRLTNPD